MAETLVLANLVVNADGTIVAYNRAGQAVTTLEQQTRRSVGSMEQNTKKSFDVIGLSSKRVVDGFFNMRRIISSLFAGFSVGGILFALTNLVQGIITATSAFKDLKASFMDVIHAIVLNESTIDSLSRRMKDLGAKSATDLAENIKALRTEIKLAEQELASGVTASGFGRIRESLGMWYGMDLGTSKTKLTAEQMLILRKNIAGAKDKLAELTKQFDSMGVAAKKAIEIIDETGKGRGGDFFNGPSSARAGGLSTENFRQFGIIEEGLNRMMDAAKSGAMTWDTFNSKIERAIQLLKELGFSQEQISGISAVEFQKSTEQHLAALDSVIEKYQAWISVLGIASGAISAAAEAGIISSKRAAQIQQALLSAEAFMRGLMELALAAAAIATPGLQWSAPLHKIAAGLFFATAAFHGAAAVGAGGGAGGGGGQGGRGGASSFNQEQSTQRNPPAQELTINFNGPVVGSDKSSVQRWLAEYVKGGMRDVPSYGTT